MTHGEHATYIRYSSLNHEVKSREVDLLHRLFVHFSLPIFQIFYIVRNAYPLRSRNQAAAKMYIAHIKKRFLVHSMGSS